VRARSPRRPEPPLQLLDKLTDTGPVSYEQPYERLKWTVLDESPHGHNAGIAYYWAKRAFPDHSPEEIAVFAVRALLDLLDEGLIRFYWGGYDEPPDPETARPATRVEVEGDLRDDGDGKTTPETVWFTATPTGYARLSAVAPELLLGYEDELRMREFVERHPEYPQELDAWMEEKGRWVLEGGRMPRPPWTKYKDYPRETKRWTFIDSLPGSRLGNSIARLYVLSGRLIGKQVDLD
jgi:hypothetical protein